MNITVPGWAKQYDKAHSPIHPWGVLLHSTEGGGEQYLDELFVSGKRDDGVVLSVHFCVFQNGDIHQYAEWEPDKCWYCWHAGSSSYPGDDPPTVSDRFIGIEQQHKAGEPYTQAQIDALMWLLDKIQTAYQGDPHWRNLLTEHRIVAPTRKTDPTTPWDSIKGPIYAAWEVLRPEESDMTAQEHELLCRIRVATLDTSFDVAILQARQDGDTAKAAALQAQQAKDVASEKAKLDPMHVIW
jgi:N-acetyl-anhydromuramyl-L-alanine amidase AmpD